MDLNIEKSSDDDFFSLVDQLALNTDDFINDSISINRVGDFESRLKGQINNREGHYTKLLSKFIEAYDKKQKQKHLFKWIFFIGMMACLVAITFFAITLGIKCLKWGPESFNNFIPTVIASVVSFISGIIGIPLVITNYLFDNKEDEKLIDLIGKMQTHDIDSLNHISK